MCETYRSRLKRVSLGLAKRFNFNHKNLEYNRKVSFFDFFLRRYCFNDRRIISNRDPTYRDPTDWIPRIILGRELLVVYWKFTNSQEQSLGLHFRESSADAGARAKSERHIRERVRLLGWWKLRVAPQPSFRYILRRAWKLRRLQHENCVSSENAEL